MALDFDCHQVRCPVVRLFDDSSEHLKRRFVGPAIDTDAAERQFEAPNEHATYSTSRLVWFRIGNEAVVAWAIETTGMGTFLVR